MTVNSLLAVPFAGATLLLVIVLAAPAHARGGGFSRSGAAIGGGFSSGPGSPRAQPAATRQTDISSAHGRLEDNRNEFREELQQRRQELGGRDRGTWRDVAGYDYYGDDWDDHWHGTGDDTGTGVVVGAATSAAPAAYLTTLPCSGASLVVNEEVYYECEATWYRRGFLGGTVVYLPSSPPPGYLN